VISGEPVSREETLRAGVEGPETAELFESRGCGRASEARPVVETLVTRSAEGTAGGEPCTTIIPGTKSRHVRRGTFTEVVAQN